MNKSLAASQNLMKNYLSEMLTEDVEAPVIKESELVATEETKKLNKLLQGVNATERHIDKAPNEIISKKSESNKLREIENKIFDAKNNKETLSEVVIETNSEETSTATSKHNYREGSFQAMFFDVAGLTVAVPLIELGGIHNVDNITSLVGKPAWFKGVMLHRDEKISIVDTAQWVMPEKCNEELLSSLNYQFVIMLNNSNWGLLAENLIDTVTLQSEDVKWLEPTSTRPWLSGLVKDRKCALLEVDALINLLNDGMDINQI